MDKRSGREKPPKENEANLGLYVFTYMMISIERLQLYTLLVRAEWKLSERDDQHNVFTGFSGFGSA